jgi:chromate transporter
MRAGEPALDPGSAPAPPTRTAALREVALLFLRLGVTSFGGPAAHVALMEDEVVRRRAWLGREEFLDLYGATQLVPGPNSTEMAIHLGYRRAGWAGLVVAGTCFIVPAALVTLALAWAYVRFGALPEVRWVLYGVKPVIIAVVGQALAGLGPTALKRRPMIAVAALSAAASLAGAHELAILLGAGVFSATLARRTPPGAAMALGGAPAASAIAATSFGLGPLFLFFLKVGAVLFGSGYVLLAFLRADLVDRYHWMTEAQLLDAVAAGQITPGPVFTTATFVGYVLGGGWGALLATLGIFLPAFVFVAVSGPLVPRLRSSAATASFLDGVNAASLALMAVVTWDLGRAALIDAPTIAIAAASLVLLLRFRVSSTWLVLGGALLGALVHLAR